MSGSEKFSDEEKREMVDDAMNADRGKVFNAARILSHQGSLDDYIDFLSNNMAFVEYHPSEKVTSNFKL